MKIHNKETFREIKWRSRKGRIYIYFFFALFKVVVGVV